VLTNSYEAADSTDSDNKNSSNSNNSSGSTGKDILALLKSPKFINYRLSIDKPKIKLKSSPTAQEWIELNLGSICITNNNYHKTIPQLANDRKINFMWAEKISLDCKEMSIFIKSAANEIRVSDNIHFNLDIEMFPLFSLYNQYFKTKTGIPFFFLLALIL
jgi:hypothetical protein